MTHYLLVGFVITTSFIHLCPGCSPAYPWNSLTFLERASRADTIVNGIVTNLYPIPEHPTSFPEAYIAEFETDCIFRGTTIRKYVNITNMGYLTSCSRTLVDNGTEYIILLRMNDAGELEPDEINIQTAAFVADEEHWSDLGVLCNITAAPPVGEQVVHRT
ncbi:uncharacterized protein LOC102802853 [Saccoglossus kowalevskii]|uniref:Uncharacterized protein LOC102802853 n=1 Tax=Saccoglossus kowalevskii TaxID=10224 RepID=A0ABM0M3V9_SACKO|nr:PREDICTED: uncharacterized protein LOC102802853 [Saccoglossus kowalevskii]